MDPHNFFKSRIRITHQNEKQDTDQHQSQISGVVEVQNEAMVGRGRSQWRCRSLKS
jgi:hypothetical protein